jgi:predicted acylesterase/phospholipase RssA
MYAATQIGVLRALEEHRLAPGALVGIGAGAWIAGLYACNPSALEVHAAARALCRQGKRLADPVRVGWARRDGEHLPGLIRGDRIAALLMEITARRALDELEIALAVPVIALPTRKTLVFASHCPKDGGDMVWTQQAPVALAIRAAMATPMLLKPAMWMGVPLIGAAGLPAAAAALRQLRPLHAVAVDARAQRPHGKLDLWEIAALSVGAQDGPLPCLPGWRTLTPRLPENVRVTSLEALDLCAEIGYAVAMEAMPRIKAMIGPCQGKVLPFPQRGLPR